eukprot:5536-Eustigmatos_ZCMA.PRE.1
MCTLNLLGRQTMIEAVPQGRAQTESSGTHIGVQVQVAVVCTPTMPSSVNHELKQLMRLLSACILLVTEKSGR